MDTIKAIAFHMAIIVGGILGFKAFFLVLDWMLHIG